MEGCKKLGKCDQNACRLHMESCEILNFTLIKISSTAWHGAVHQDCRSKSHVLKDASQPSDWKYAGLPEHAEPVWEGYPLTLGSKPL